jgi:HMG (high mobility group) box
MRGVEPVHDPSALGFSGLARTVAAKWKALDVGAKAKFVALAEQDRERYRRELSQYNNRILTMSSSVPTENVTVVRTDLKCATKRGQPHVARFLVKESRDAQLYPKPMQRQCR